MAANLDEWQLKLEGYFENLAEHRKLSNLKIFALEHGLPETVINEIATLLRNEFEERGSRPLDKHWLLWVIYATEQGYQYDGKEYWPSFEIKLPNWNVHNRNRKLISLWFNRFQDTYNGVVPSGAWAEFYCNISGPTTHAVLPLFLRNQFIKRLHKFRYDLKGLNEFNPMSIGRFMAENAYGVSKRLAKFFKNEELVGRIAFAILRPEESKIICDEQLLDVTLNRIVNDLKLSSVGNLRNETSRALTEEFKNISKSKASNTSGDSYASDDLTERSNRPSIRPELRLRRRVHDTWGLFIEIPSFKALADIDEKIHDFLLCARVIIDD
ncbi:MAG: hypothetical protein V6Z81_08070, partial [Parvularculales bacterium]